MKEIASYRLTNIKNGSKGGGRNQQDNSKGEWPKRGRETILQHTGTATENHERGEWHERDTKIIEIETRSGINESTIELSSD